MPGWIWRSTTERRVPVKWTPQHIGRIKPLVFLLGLVPLLRWLVLGMQGELGANPPEFLIRSSGIWALVALCLTLAITPLRRFLAQPALVRLRRMLGLYAFFYTVLHVLGWAWWERNGSLASMWADIIQRPFIAIGTLAFVLMLPMAITSTRGWMRRLGSHWQTLHRAIYAIGVLSIWHFWLMRAGKNDFFEPTVYGLVLALLLLARIPPRRPTQRP